MRRPRSHRGNAPADGRRVSAANDAIALRAANLSAPVFRESWQAGSPLNWCEFIACWRAFGAGDESAAPSGEGER